MEYQDFLKKLSSPARSALEYAGIDSFEKLAALTRKQLISLHGVGPKTLPTVEECLRAVGMKLKD